MKLTPEQEQAEREAFDNFCNNGGWSTASTWYTWLARAKIAATERERLRAELATMCDEVVRCWQTIEGLYTNTLTDCGIYEFDEQTQEQFNESMERYVRSKRPARVIEILAERAKEQSCLAENVPPCIADQEKEEQWK